MPRFVFTGASGSGKSSVIEELAGQGFRVQREIGREIVKEQAALNGTAVPWADKLAFRDIIFERSVEAFDAMSPDAATPIFFDRSFLDAIAYSNIIDAKVIENMHRQADARRFDNPVFLFSPWEEIYGADEERRHSFEEAVRDHEANVSVYDGYGYRLVAVPRKPVLERVDFILQAIFEA